MTKESRPTCSHCGSTDLVLNISTSWITKEQRTKIHDITTRDITAMIAKKSA